MFLCAISALIAAEVMLEGILYEFPPFLGREKHLLQYVPIAAAGQESPATHCMSASEGRVKVVALWLIAPDIWVLLSHALFIFYFLPLINCEPHHGCQTGICRTEACGKAVIYGSLETKWHF